MASPFHDRSQERSYLIIGAGVFGVSAAYHLIKKYPSASVTIVDRDAFDADSRVAASWDWNKVVRADYDDIVYCQMALESQDVFKNDPLWKPYFHETGIYWMCRSAYAQDVINNYKKLGRDADLKAVPVEQAKKLYGGLFEDADYSDVREVLVNKTSGWAQAGDVLRAITRECLKLGVKYVVGETSTLKFDDEGRCVGVETTNRKSLYATHVILCTGAYTTKLLEMSAQKSGNKNLRADDRILAAGITTGMVKLNDQDYRRFKDMPVGVQGYTPATGPFIGSLPPTKDDDRALKWWGQTIFANTHEALPGRYFSAPPAQSDYAQWDVSGRLKEDINYANRVFYGRKGAHFEYSKHRICWDAFTTSADFIISPHSAAKGLYLATCGNFHGFKFFPVLGKYIVQMLEGELEPKLQQKWAWDRERPGPDLNPDYPRAEMRDLVGDREKLVTKL